MKRMGGVDTVIDGNGMLFAGNNDTSVGCKNVAVFDQRSE